ncbi:hypothetical protein [Streptomyces lydicus]|uniref:hypothetical protein n=1 Tax=Streptomyces lydicus TaxID=47763 RepID=UPI00378B5383
MAVDHVLTPRPPLRAARAERSRRGARAEALDLVARGAVTPLYEVFAKEDIARAVAKAAAGQVRFRAVVSY